MTAWLGIPPSLCLRWHHSLYKWTRPFPSNFSVCKQPKPEPRNKASKCLSLLALFSLLAGKYRSYLDQNGWVPCLSTRYTYVCALYVMWLWTVVFQCSNRPHENIWTRDTMATWGVVRGNPLVFPVWWVTNNGYLNCCFVCTFQRGLGMVSFPNQIRWVYRFQYDAWENARYWKQSALVGSGTETRLGMVYWYS